MTEKPNGLNDIYRRHADSALREEVEVGGYPALHSNFNDNRSSGECSLWIGVNDSAVLFLDVFLRDSPEAEDPCG
ncbi:DUF3558 domain-containing protein [Saccharomonospora saliphila]|uniref:hypothetical protein n=1 Tax=Saccharomonospora saliphila TaxID=369829 RepID=UPI00037ABCED|nr:hypothetical protein [Saccharomonospora saliphila]